LAIVSISNSWSLHSNPFLLGAVVVVIIWELDLKLPVQSVPITTKVVSLTPAHGEVYSIQHYVIKFVSDFWQVCGLLRVLLYPPQVPTMKSQDIQH